MLSNLFSIYKIPGNISGWHVHQRMNMCSHFLYVYRYVPLPVTYHRPYLESGKVGLILLTCKTYLSPYRDNNSHLTGML